MAYNRNHARRMLSASELDLFEASLKERVTSLGPAELRKKVDRTRKLRDKYSDLFRRQSLTTRRRTGTKRGPSGTANERTAQKATIFAEVLARFEKQLDALERAQARESKRAAVERARASKGGGGRTTPKAGTSSPARSPRSSPGSKGPTGPTRAESARKSSATRTPRNTKISAHVRASGKRSQARRDNR